MFRKIKLVIFVFLLLTLSCISYLPLGKDPSAEKNSDTETEEKEELTDTDPPGSGETGSDKPGKSGSLAVVFLPGDSFVFWNKLVTQELMQEYKAVNGCTKCNIFMGDILMKYFDEKVYNSVFPDGMKSPNTLYADWKTNKNLIRLKASEHTIEEIQQMANDNYLIIMAYRYEKGPGHVAFVGNKKLKLRTIPPVKNLEGKNGAELKTSWLPVMVQAGTYTGITSMVYASNSWLRQDLFANGTVCYYLVKI